jgi:hypothetical protein
MKRITVEFSIKDTKEGRNLLSTADFEPATGNDAWKYSNVWESVGFDNNDEDDKERMENTLEELQMTLTGLEYCIDLR